MLVTKQPVLKRFWHPVIPIAQLLTHQPQSFQLLGQNIILWLKADGKSDRPGIIMRHQLAALQRHDKLVSLDKT